MLCLTLKLDHPEPGQKPARRTCPPPTPWPSSCVSWESRASRRRNGAGACALLTGRAKWGSETSAEVAGQSVKPAAGV